MDAGPRIRWVGSGVYVSYSSGLSDRDNKVCRPTRTGVVGRRCGVGKRDLVGGVGEE